MSTRLCLLTVHAHPDDEASKGPATVARYHAEGIHTVLVCCTGGEEGDILNPAMDTPEVRADLAGVRRRELEAAADVIGYDEVVMLGYRDSGMKDTPANAHPDCFAQAPLEEAVGRLVAVIRRVRPQVIVTYDDDQQGYPHPDHLRDHEISVAAFDAAGDPVAFPEAGRGLPAPEALLRGLVGGPGHGHAREVRRARPGVALRRGLAGAGQQDDPHLHHGRRHLATTPMSGARPCWPTPPRSTRRRRSGSGCPPRWPAPSIPWTSTSWPAAWWARPGTV